MANVVVPMRGFSGLNERIVAPDPSPQTSDLRNVTVRHGRVSGRKGVDLYLSVDDGHTVDEGINGLLEYRRSDLSNIIVRVGQTSIERLNAGGTAWDVITGTALTGAAGDRAQSTVYQDKLIITNEGSDQPQFYDASAVFQDFADTSIPYAKSIASGLGFVFLGNISEDGTFTDVTDGALKIRYSDDPYATDGWDACDVNELVLDETPGEIRAMKFLGRQLLVYKSDAIVALTFVGGKAQFVHQKLPFDKGIIAPLSLAEVGAKGHVFYATDQLLYATNGSTVQPLPVNASDTLQNSIDVSDAENVVAATMPDDETYNLFYPRTAGGTPDARIVWNYNTGEWTHHTYDGHSFSRVLGTRRSNTTAFVLLGLDPADDNTYHIDTGQNDTDAASTTTVPDRYYTTDWQDFGIVGDKYFAGATLQFKMNADTRAEISVARDHEEVYRHPRMVDLTGPKMANVSNKSEVRVRYQIPPQFGEVFSIKVRFFHDGSTNVAELQSIHASIIPIRQDFRQGKTNSGANLTQVTSTETST